MQVGSNTTTGIKIPPNKYGLKGSKINDDEGGSPPPPSNFTYKRPGGVDTYHRPDGTSIYKRP